MFRVYFSRTETLPGDVAHQPVPQRNRVLPVRQQHEAQQCQSHPHEQQVIMIEITYISFGVSRSMASDIRITYKEYRLTLGNPYLVQIN
jgi:hypothetical protein